MARVPSSFDSKFLLEWKILYMPALYQVPLVYIWPEVVGYKIRTNEENTAFFSLETIDSAGLCKRRCIVSSRRKGYCVVGRQCSRQGHLFLLTHNSYYLFNDFYSKLKRKYDILELFREWKFNKHKYVYAVLKYCFDVWTVSHSMNNCRLVFLLSWILKATLVDLLRFFSAVMKVTCTFLLENENLLFRSARKGRLYFYTTSHAIVVTV